MSPRHFTKAIYGPYYLSSQHYMNAVPNTPTTKFEKFTYFLFKYTGLNKLIAFLASPDKISRKTESLPYQATSGDEIDLKALREKRRGSKQSNQ